MLRQFTGEPGAAVIWPDMNSWKDALLCAVVGFAVMVQIPRDYFTSLIMDAEGLFVTKPLPLLCHIILELEMFWSSSVASLFVFRIVLLFEPRFHIRADSNDSIALIQRFVDRVLYDFAG